MKLIFNQLILCCTRTSDRTARSAALAECVAWEPRCHAPLERRLIGPAQSVHLHARHAAGKETDLARDGWRVDDHSLSFYPAPLARSCSRYVMDLSILNRGIFHAR